MRRLLFPCMLLAAAIIPSSGEEARPRLGNKAEMTAEPVLLDASNPNTIRVDALTYRGGVRLDSPDPAFGGFSSILIDGDKFTLVSDGGNIVRFRMGQDMKPFEMQFGDLPFGPGTGWAKASRDSESMTRDPATGSIWIGFENANMIYRYDAELTKLEGRVAPPEMRKWDGNGGAEAMVRLANGQFLVLSETGRLMGTEKSPGVWFSGDPTAKGTRSFKFTFRVPPGGFRPSDMTQLPDGRVLVLVRRVSIDRWFESKLVLIDPRAIRPGKTIGGKEIAAFTIPLTRDNFEAIAAVREGQDTVLWIASDDNRQPIQQSLLMKFRLDLVE